jgi:hypothetical protein
MPERHHPRSRSLLGLHRNQAESVVGEMHREVESDDNATDRTEPGETSRWNQTALNVTAKRTRKTETRNLLILRSGGSLTMRWLTKVAKRKQVGGRRCHLGSRRVIRREMRS